MRRSLLAAFTFGSVSISSVSLAEMDPHYFDAPLCVYKLPEPESIQKLTVRVPIVVSVLDSEGKPVEGAAVALMRLGEGGYTDKDVQMPGNSRTNASGMALLHYPMPPGWSALHAATREQFDLIGAVTTVHPDHGTASIELAERCKTPLKFSGVSMVPWVTIQFSGEASKESARQAAPIQPATRPNLKPQVHQKPQPNAEKRTR